MTTIRNTLDLTEGGDVVLEGISRKTFSFFSSCTYKHRVTDLCSCCYKWLLPHGSKPMRQSGDRPLKLERSFYWKHTVALPVGLKKTLVNEHLMPWSAAGILHSLLHFGTSLLSRNLCKSPLFLSSSLPPLPFSVDKLSETLTTQPGKIARSHAARQVYPWPWFPLTTFPSAAK